MAGECTEEEDRVQLTTEDNIQDYIEDEQQEIKMQIITVTKSGFIERHFGFKHCTVCLYLCLSLLLFGSAIVVIVIIIDVVLPYQSVQSFVNTTCTPIQLIVQDGKTCVCGVGCTAQYRCLSILVSYVDIHNKTHNATVYENESTMGKQCSFYPACKHSPVEINEAVAQYEHHYGVIGLPFKCLYSLKYSDEVIRTHKFKLYHAVNGIVWSAFVFIMSIVILVIVIRKRGCDEIQKVEPDRNMDNDIGIVTVIPSDNA